MWTCFPVASEPLLYGPLPTSLRIWMTVDRTDRRTSWAALVCRMEVYGQIAASMKEVVLVFSKCFRKVNFRWHSCPTLVRIEVWVLGSRIGIVEGTNCSVLYSPNARRPQLLPVTRSFVLQHRMQQKHRTFGVVRFLFLNLGSMYVSRGGHPLVVTRLSWLPAPALAPFLLLKSTSGLKFEIFCQCFAAHELEQLSRRLRRERLGSTEDWTSGQQTPCAITCWLTASLLGRGSLIGV